MPRSGGDQQMSYNLAFFIWLSCQLIMVENWSYNRTEFRGDPDIPLPEGDDFDDGGEQKKIVFWFFIVFFIYVFDALTL